LQERRDLYVYKIDDNESDSSVFESLMANRLAGLVGGLHFYGVKIDPTHERLNPRIFNGSGLISMKKSLLNELLHFLIFKQIQTMSIAKKFSFSKTVN